MGIRKSQRGAEEDEAEEEEEEDGEEGTKDSDQQDKEYIQDLEEELAILSLRGITKKPAVRRWKKKQSRKEEHQIRRGLYFDLSEKIDIPKQAYKCASVVVILSRVNECHNVSVE